MNTSLTTTTRIALFREKEIRKILHNNEWWFAIEDIVAALTNSIDPKGYIRDLRRRDEEMSKGWGQIAHTLWIETDGGRQQMNCANTEGVFRIIQSIPSPKAEPFKRWLAKVGYERVQEIEDPELATKRTRALYKAKGYPDAWIEKRMRGIAVREQLTTEWKNRGVKEGLEYGILTTEISGCAFRYSGLSLLAASPRISNSLTHACIRSGSCTKSLYERPPRIFSISSMASIICRTKTSSVFMQQNRTMVRLLE